MLTTSFTLSDLQTSFIEVTQFPKKKPKQKPHKSTTQLLLIMHSILINSLKIIYNWRATIIFLQAQLAGPI